ALGLAAVALAWRTAPQRRILFVWLGTGLAAIVLALGTDLHLNGRPLNDAHPFWLPAYYLAQLPFVNLMRTWSRFVCIAILFVSLPAGVGAARIAGWVRSGRRARLVQGALVVLVLIDVMPGSVETTLLQPRAADLWLARQPGSFAVAALPVYNDVLN